MDDYVCRCQALIDVREALQQAVEALYSMFESYKPAPDSFIGCACGVCVRDEQQTVLHTRPLRELSRQDLDPIAFSAFNEPSDLKYFLPRACELLARSDNMSAWGMSQYFSQLGTDWGWGTWRDWPEDERHCLEHYFQCLWQRETTRLSDDTDSRQERLAAFGRLFDPSPYLPTWKDNVAAIPRSIRNDPVLQRAIELAIEETPSGDG